MARRTAGRGRSSSSRSSGKEGRSRGKKVYADDDLIIEDEEPAPKRKKSKSRGSDGSKSRGSDGSSSRKRSSKSSTTSSSRGKSSRGSRSSSRSSTSRKGSSSGRRRADDFDDEPQGGGRRRGRAPAKGGGNNDLVVYLLTGIGVLVLITIGLIFAGGSGDKGGGDDREVIKEAKKLLSEAGELNQKFNRAERSGNESERAKYIVLAHKKYTAVLDKINSLRRPPYADKDEQWLPGYEQFEKYESEASQRLHDISKRAKTDDNFE